MNGRGNDRRAFTLAEAIVYMSLVVAVATVSTYVLAPNAQIQSQALAWANDDTVVQSILRRLREDVGLATQADAPGGALLRLSLPEGQVEYRFVGGKVRRSLWPSADAGPIWHLVRTAMEWRIEALRGGTVVWTGVAIRAPTSPEGEPVVQRYAVAQRVGGSAPGGRP